MARAGRAGGGGRSGGGRSSFGGGSRSGGGRSSFGGGRSGGGSLFGGSSNNRSAGGGIFGNSSGGRLGGGGLFGSPSRNSSIGGGLFGSGLGRNTRRNNTVIINNMNNNRFGGSGGAYGGHVGNGNNPNHKGGGTGPGGCSRGCLIAVAFIVVFFVIMALILSSMNGGDSDITASTIQREPLPAGSVTETAYYTDELGWIGNETQLLKGLKNFYRATGVQPHLYITDNVNGAPISDVSQLEVYAQELYTQLFSDEAHLLFIFYERDGDYADYYLCGAQAKTVIDREAGDILLDYIDRYYYSGDMSDEEFFSTSFDHAAARIMTVEESPWPMVWIAFAAVAIILLLFLFWRERVKQKNRKAEQDAKILETPLEQFGDSEVDELEKKYRDKDEF